MQKKRYMLAQNHRDTVISNNIFLTFRLTHYIEHKLLQVFEEEQ